MSKRSFRAGLVPVAVLLLACQEPAASAPVSATLAGDALVIEAVAEEEQSWFGKLKLEAAPAGEYAVFTSSERPTSLAGLAGLDLAACTPLNCTAPGLGRFSDHQKVVLTGTLELDISDPTQHGDAKSTLFIVLVRRGAASDAALAVGGSVTIHGNAGCGGSNPAPPSLSTGTLGDLPPATPAASPDADAGAGAASQPDASS